MTDDQQLLEIPPLAPKPGGLGMIAMRDYQIECADCIYEGWRDNNALVAVMATGLGKTVVAAEIIIRWPGLGRILFIAHVRELIDQAVATIEYHTGDRPSVEMGIRSESREGDILTRSQVLVASIQSMTRRLHRFNPLDFDLVIIDEFHHAAANTYRALWDWIQKGNPHCKLLGITATPNRADKLSLGCIAENCAYELGIRDGIDLGWLVPIRQQYIVVDGLDFSKCRTVASDLNESDLETTMLGGQTEADEMTPEQLQELQERQERMLHAIAAPAVKESQGRPGIVYCVTVNHATRMAEVLRRYPGVTAEVISGKTPEKERDDMVGRFKAGQLQFLVNVGVCTEGFDVPGAHLIVMARPTKSLVRYTQMVGRATRPISGIVDRYETPELRQEAISNSVKPNAVVLDFVGNSGRHKLVSSADVLAGDMPETFVAAAIEEMKKTGATEDIRQAAWRKKEEHDQEVERRRNEEKRKQEERRKEMQAREEARRARIRADADYRAREVNPFDRSDTVPDRQQSAFRGGSTDLQIDGLAKRGIPRETAMKWTVGQAGAVLSDLKSRSGGSFIVPFGKHMGKPLSKIPVSYLKWAGENVQRQDFQQNLELYRQEWREAREAEQERLAIQDESLGPMQGGE